ncbi:MAG: Fic family protein [Steroidobacteraceae bacterium]
MKADIEMVPDRGEPVTLMEPLLVGEHSAHRTELNDLALELAEASQGFRRSLPPGLVESLASLVRSMNCYYSNLIEGHDTHPVDIERALKGDYSSDERRRNLQLEAQAHIALQQWLDGGALGDRATTVEGICELHRRFHERLPEKLLWSEDPHTGERLHVFPGQLRTRDVQVGQHIAVSPGAVPRFLSRYEEGYAPLSRMQKIIAAAAAHHRLVWIHPFLDGNGRVARLMSHAMMLDLLDTAGLWSIARGLARQVGEYKRHLAACDQPRRDDVDGRGALSEENLAAFTAFFLRTCLDQVRFMEALMKPESLRTRIQLWAEEQVRLGKLPGRVQAVLDAILYRGELLRADVAAVVGTGERQARRVTSALIESGVLTSGSSRAPLRLAFPAELASRWVPGLFPEKLG